MNYSTAETRHFFLNQCNVCAEFKSKMVSGRKMKTILCPSLPQLHHLKVNATQLFHVFIL